MAKFKVGDRVRRIGSEAFVPVGTLGTVIRVHPEANSITVRWDWKNDESGYSYHEQGVWLELVLSKPTNVTEAIAAYTRACEAFEAAQLQVEKAKQDVADARLNLRDALDGEA